MNLKNVSLNEKNSLYFEEYKKDIHKILSYLKIDELIEVKLMVDQMLENANSN